MKTLLKFILMLAALPVGQAMAATYTCTAKSGSKDWSNSSSWTNCNNKVPQDGDSVIIPSGSTVTLDTNSNQIASLTVASGGVLQGTSKDLDLQGPGNLTNGGSLSLGSGDIKIEGNFTNSGTFTAGTGRVEFKGNAVQTIAGNVSFYDLKVDNGSRNGLTLNGNVVVSRTPSGNAETGGLVKLTDTCPTDYTLTSNGGAVVQHSCALAAPTATTGAAASVSGLGATLNGTVSSNGASTTVTFDYGLTTAYGSSATASTSPLASSASSTAVSAAVAGLTCGGTTYHFRVKAVNSAGITLGVDQTFTTAVCSVPAVTSINRSDFNPARAGFPVSWTVIFNNSMTGVDATDFALVQTGGPSGASITGVSGSGTTWIVTASTGTAGTIGLNLVDNDSILAGGVPLGGVGVNGNFTGQTYTLIASACTGASDILFCDDFERSNPGAVGNGWTVVPSSVKNCTGATGNTGCSGIDSDVAPFDTPTNPRANPSRSMFTRWSTVSVDSPVVSLAGRTGAQLSFWMRRGRDTFSECPEAAGENYLVQYYASNNAWKVLAQYPSSPSAPLCDGQIFTPVIELPPDALHANFKMRFYQPSGSGRSGSGGAPGVVGYDYWHMDDVVIRATNGPSYVGAFCENFEAGTGRWSITAENYSSGNIGDARIGTKAYQSAGHELDLRWGYVTASTFKTDLTGVSGDITYWVRSGTSSTLDPIDNENLIVEYLNSAGAWATLNTYLGSAPSGTAYLASYAIPADAKHPNFRLRFRQVAGSGYDKSYWHVDDVCVGNATATSDLALTKTGDSALIPGTTTTYTLRVTNNGPDAMSGAAQVVDTLPNGLTYVSGGGGSSGWTCAAPGQTITCNWSGTLANGESAPTLILTASVGASVTGSLTNVAALTGTGTDPDASNNTASFTSGNFIPYFIFTNGICVDGIAIGQSGQTCNRFWPTMSPIIAGQGSASIYITAVNASGVPTKLSSSASTTVSTQFALSCHDPIANAGVQASFSAVAGSLPLCAGGGAEPTAWSAATNLTFAAGAASVASSHTFTYGDVGEVELFMRNSVATNQVGKSSSFVVKPAGFVLSGIRCTTYADGSCATSAIASPGNNPAATTASGLAFIQAGQPFTATVTALTASGKTKADAGTLVNCTTTPSDCTPNFGKEIQPKGVVLSVENSVDFETTMVAPPELLGGFGDFNGGSATGADFSWAEVGIITLTPAVSGGDYLGAGDVTGTASGKVGRFVPDHFDTAVTQVSGVPMACPDGLCPINFDGVVYSGQPFSLTVTAKNANGDTTVNYNTTTGFSKTAALSAFGALGATTAPSGAGALGLSSMTAFSVGTLTQATQRYTFTATPTGPTNIYIRASDGDTSSRRATDPTTTSIEGGVRVVSGRIRMTNAYGSERLGLPMTATVQYYNATGKWVTSLTDSTSAFGLSTPTIVKGPLVLANLTSTVSQDACASSVVFCNGQKTFVLRSANATGSADISLNAPSYLLGPAPDSARATFGIYKSPLIYRRENY